MADVLQVAYTLANINVVKVLIQILNKSSTQKLIINLNTRVQLYQDGENSQGVKLSSIGGKYKSSTARIKRSKGQPSNRVTLYDTGDFYKSFKVKPTAQADFIIDSDPMKGKYDLFSRWGEDVEGLTEENHERVLEYLNEEFWRYIFRKSK